MRRTNTASKFVIATAFSAFVLTVASSASAQEAPGGVAPAGAPPAGIQTASNAATAGAGGTDHDRVVNQVGLRYFGFVGAPGAMGMPGPGVHNVGVRYWLSRMIGIEGGVGLSLATGGGGTTFGFALTGGLPINLAATQHLAIHIIPNVTFGIPNVDPFVLAVLLGADAAAELSFGFIGVPQMSLQARMGLNIGLTVAGGGAAFGLGTTAGSGANVWDVIAGSVSATYYFGR